MSLARNSMPVMEDLESVKCVVCSGLAQYAVRTPCCSILACRVCAITKIIKRTGIPECGACDSSPVFLSSLVPQQQVRRRVEEMEVWKQVNENEPAHNNNCQSFHDWQKSLKRALNDTNETNMIEPKRMKLNKSDHSAEIVKEIQAVETNTETINSEITERTNCEVAVSIRSEVINNSSSEITKTTDIDKEQDGAKSALEAPVVKHRQESIEVEQDADQKENSQGTSCIEKELTDAKETLTIKEQELAQLKIFIEHKNEELNNVKLTLAEEKIKKIVEEKAVLFESLTKERQNASKIKEELATKDERLEQLMKDLAELKKVGRNFREKLSLSEEELKTLKSVKEENKKIQEEKQQLIDEQQNFSSIREELANKEEKL